ncbi:TPA: type II toxin-antitoxin system RelE/ParE family toxin [Streptococcus suis]|nr:type II toxin-antitoxin system RelE/ParE family toxin [Streptococcus suis]
MDKYRVNLPLAIYEELADIRSYIREELKSPDAADKKIQELIAGLRSLEIFPERGFNVDERSKKGPLVPGQLTRGLPIKKDYIAIYNIDEITKGRKRSLSCRKQERLYEIVQIEYTKEHSEKLGVLRLIEEYLICSVVFMAG